MAEQSVRNVFACYQESIQAEQDVREKIRETTRELERFTKPLLALLQRIHTSSSHEDLKKITDECRQILNENIKPLLVELNGKVPHGEYYRFHDIWRFLTTKLSFAVSLTYYLETDLVAERQIVADALGLTVSLTDENGQKTNIFLDLDDYLQGILQMASELSRFSVNSVTKGDVRRPRKIFKTMSDLQQGFSELNLKNDHLRRMFDALKYDIKRVEQVIYDLTIRGIDVNTNEPQAANSGSSNVAATTEQPASTTTD